jgi:hypothetical protein
MNLMKLRNLGDRFATWAILMVTSSLMAASMAVPCFGQGVTLALEPTETVLAPGAQFDVSLRLENPDQVLIQGLQAAIAWDSSKLQLLSLTLPGDLPGSPPVLAMAWNAPPPVGPGGDVGCSQWWDGQGDEAFSLGLVIDGTWSQASSPLAILHMRVTSFAPNGLLEMAPPAPDLSCGWLGPIATDPVGDIVPTMADSLDLTVSDLPPPTTLQCGEAAGIVYLSWQEPILFDSVLIEREGILIGEVDAGIGHFEDPDVSTGDVIEYRIHGVAASIPSTSTMCTATVDGNVEGPIGISCILSGSGVLLGWQNPLPYDSISVTRNGAELATLPQGTTSFLDVDPGLAGIVEYEVNGSIGSAVSETSSCQVEFPIPDGFFIRGDTTSDGVLNLADPVKSLEYLFIGGDMPCASAADHDDSGTLDLGDAISLLAYLFIAGPAPAVPFPYAGTDPTPDTLGCLVSCTGPSCSPEAAGDECNSFIVIGLGNTEFDTTDLTASIDPYTDNTCIGSLLGDMQSDIWFSFVAPSTGAATFSLCGQVEFDSDLVVYEGFCQSMVQIGCNGDGDGCPDLGSFLYDVAVFEGASYLIRIGGWNALDFGTGTLTINVGIPLTDD